MRLRLTPSILLPALCCASSAAYDTAHVHIIGKRLPQDITNDRFTLSPAAARTVLAQRAGVEEFHSADLQSLDALQAINDFGLTSALFNSQPDQARQAIVLCHHDDSVMKTWPIHEQPYFTIPDAPSLERTQALLRDLALQANIPSGSMSNGKLTIIDTTTNTTFNSADLNGHTGYLIIALPSPKDENKSSVWGPYSMPTVHSGLKVKRDYTPTTTNLGSLASSSEPLRGIYPTCFPSLKTCQTLSRNCTGHGSCSLKYTDPSAADNAPSKNCYACSCTPQKRKSSDGKTITTYWGGPACQKKDVSIEFWMIALFSVAMVGLISFAVGSVWSMGDEELPSVIGAGVSGPVARR